jgi:hypothetical protein
MAAKKIQLVMGEKATKAADQKKALKSQATPVAEPQVEAYSRHKKSDPPSALCVCPYCGVAGYVSFPPGAGRESVTCHNCNQVYSATR